MAQNIIVGGRLTSVDRQFREGNIVILQVGNRFVFQDGTLVPKSMVDVNVPLEYRTGKFNKSSGLAPSEITIPAEPVEEIDTTNNKKAKKKVSRK